MEADIILASKSPRRHEILENMGISHRIIVSDFDEATVHECDPVKLTVATALGKGRTVLPHAGPSGIVIAADTVVTIDEEIMGKPADMGDARRMIRTLSGRTHDVYTGIAVLGCGGEYTGCSHTRVSMRNLSDRDIERYIAGPEPYDKAGGYSIAGTGALFIERIEGDYYSVMGMPACMLAEILSREFGIKLI